MIEKKIKILYTIPNFDTAGSGKVLYDLAKRLNKDKFEVEIACNNDKGFFFKEVKNLNLPIHIINVTTSYKPYITLIFRLIRIIKFLKKNKYNVVHSWHWSSDWTEVLACKLAGLKFIYTKKAMSWGNIHWKIKSYLSNFIITINDEIKNFFPKKKSQKLIPLGIDTNYYNPNNFKKNYSENKNFKIITVANLVPEKGVEVLIKAINLLDNPNIKLDVLGDDKNSYAEYLKKLVGELKLDNQIYFLGKHVDVRPFIMNSNLYIISTLNKGRKEGMPMALVEAMSMGIPVLGSNISGIKFVLNDFQEFLFEPNNYKELADKIMISMNLSQNSLKNIGISLRKYCIENFSIEKFITVHEELYTNLFKNKKFEI